MNDGTGYNGFARGGYEPNPPRVVDARPPKNPPTDLEYREAAIRLAIAHFGAKGMRTTQQWEIVAVAKDFEQYLRHG